MLGNIPRGSLVELHGLAGRPDLNGKRGVVNGREQDGRLGIDLPKPEGAKALRREKLLLVREAGECDPMPQRFPAPDRSGRATSGRKHILAYGDSLTAGYWDQGDRFWPYGAALVEGLLPDVVADVSVCGLSSLTAAELVESLDSARICDGADRRGVGLRKALSDNGPFDLVLIMVGTNDLGQPGYSQKIVDDICALHRVCHDQGVGTVVLSVPPSGAVEELPRYRKRWTLVNAKLSEWALSQKDKGVRLFVDTCVLVPFMEGSDLWEEDNLHLSKAGSTRLGAGLAPLLKPLLVGRSCSGCSPPDCGQVERAVAEQRGRDAIETDTSVRVAS
mmetsp:Transcript_92787/g.207784  ORF Transcript_92787/g.207784 Transcript_92787/m.207784 type:complete len:333 (-) Transcript_92787:2-1000(-)